MKRSIVFLIVTFCLVLALNSYASDLTHPFVTGEAYFDIATGHKYIKNSDTTYTEYSKKGVVLRTSVPHNLPLLTNGKYIREIQSNYYLLYERRSNYIKELKLLTINQSHPEGWSCKKALILVD